MAPYTYMTLNLENEEIHLVRLTVGQWDDKISFSIFHTPLISPKPDETESKKLSFEDLQEAVPEDWLVGQTPDRQYLFMALDAFGIPNLWNRRDPSFDSALCELQLLSRQHRTTPMTNIHPIHPLIQGQFTNKTHMIAVPIRLATGNALRFVWKGFR
jgi:hypothetical protein